MIAIDMEMPEKCDDCRLCVCEYSDDGKPEAYAYCCAKERFIAKTCDGTDKAVCNAILGKPEWCPLMQVDACKVERFLNVRELELYPYEYLENEAKGAMYRKLLDLLITSRAVRFTSEKMEEGFKRKRLRAVLSVVIPEVGQGDGSSVPEERRDDTKMPVRKLGVSCLDSKNRPRSPDAALADEQMPCGTVGCMGSDGGG